MVGLFPTTFQKWTSFCKTLKNCQKLKFIIFHLQDKRSDRKMAVIDVVLGFFKVVTFVYDIVTFPIYGITQQSWKDRTKQNLGQVSFVCYCIGLLCLFLSCISCLFWLSVSMIDLHSSGQLS